LTPWERLPLLLAASARGDAQERDRLALSAPRVCYLEQDYFGLALAFLELSNLQFMGLLYLGANYLRALEAAGFMNGEPAERTRNAALALGYLFNVRPAGWRLFCQAHALEPEVLWADLPGFDLMREAEPAAGEAAFPPEAFGRWLERSGRAGVPTAEGIAAGLRRSLRARAEFWG
jgi:hypothetical protein